MKRYSLLHLSDQNLLLGLAAVLAQDRATTATLLAHIAEVDARELYLPAAYPSMFAYCVGELRLSEDSAFKRIRAARKAREFPAIFEAIGEGRLHLGAVVLLAPYLTAETADELLAAATHKSKSEVERLLAARFPRPDLPTMVREVSSCSQSLTPPQLAPGPVGIGLELVPEPVDQPSPGHAQALPDRPKLTPLAPERFALQVTIDRGTHDKLRRVQELLSHQLPSGDLAQVLDRALDALIVQLEKRRFAATAKPRAGGAVSSETRHIPAHVQRAVWKRDDGRCTFVSDTGRRCASRNLIEFDHVEEVARGGVASVSGIRLRCRAHNQYGAECTFGAGFMDEKRQAAAEARAAALQRTAAATQDDGDVIPWLRQLGYRATEAREAAAFCEHMRDAPLEERVRVALSYFHPRGVRTPAPGADTPAFNQAMRGT